MTSVNITQSAVQLATSSGYTCGKSGTIEPRAKTANSVGDNEKLAMVAAAFAAGQVTAAQINS